MAGGVVDVVDYSYRGTNPVNVSLDYVNNDGGVGDADNIGGGSRASSAAAATTR